MLMALKIQTAAAGGACRFVFRFAGYICRIFTYIEIFRELMK